METVFKIDSLRQALAEGCPPEWASGWGEDRHGIFVEFTLQEVTQRLRWMPPGRFLMGSPENELGRDRNEGPQHEVFFLQGFWLFDTVCTQALWQTVMGNNPSRFQNPNRPVEQVSWLDIQAFLARINKQVPGLELALPSEAQWEYACRAGTTTPFSFGSNITPEQVNYNGNHPYMDGIRGNNRKKSVSVASLPPNSWGLFEMHGNTREWCEDVWQDSYRGAPMNGQAWLLSESMHQSGMGRVVRGGTWYHGARNVRSASRDYRLPDAHINNLSFRCIRAQT